MSLEQEQSNLNRKNKELADLQKKLADQEAKHAAAVTKANSTQTAAAKTKSESTRKSKLSAYRSALRDQERTQKEISRLQGKVAFKQKEICAATSKVERERKREEQASMKKDEQTARKINSEMSSISRTIENHAARLTSLESTPNKVSVLYLGTSPQNEGRLRVDAEARDIHEAIRKSDNPQCIEFNDRWAVRQTDLLQALNETNPDIVHFSGHGSEDGCIILEDQFGNSVALDKERLSMVIGATAKHVRLIVFNACYSDEEAVKMLQHVDAVIGMTDSISDSAAMAFAAQLYSSIGFGLDLATAFNQAVAAVIIISPAEAGIPNLRTRDGLHAKDIVFVEG